MCPGPARKKRAPGQPFLAPGRHWNGRNVNSLQLLVPVALLGWSKGRGGTPATQVAYPPPPGGCSTARPGLVQPGPQPPAPQTGAAQHPCKGLQTPHEKFTMGFFATLVAYLNPCLNFFYFFSKCARARKVWGPTGGRCFCKACGGLFTLHHRRAGLGSGAAWGCGRAPMLVCCHLGGLHLATALPLGAAHGLGGGWH